MDKLKPNLYFFPFPFFQLHPGSGVRAQERAAVRPADPAAGQLDRARPRGLRQLRQVLRLAHLRHLLRRLHRRTLGLQVG